MSDWFQHCRIASSPVDGNINISSPPASIDGVSLSAGYRVLLKHQNTSSQNTTYTYNGAMLVATEDVLTPRATVQIGPGGACNANTVWALNDTTNNVWTRQIIKANVRDFGALGAGGSKPYRRRSLSCRLF